MSLKHVSLALGLLAVASFAPAQAAVTITEETLEITSGGGTYPDTVEQVPVYTMENQWLRVYIVRGPVVHPEITPNNDTAMGEVLGVFKKTGTDQESRQVTVLQGWTTAGPSVSNNRSYIQGRNRISAGDPKAGMTTVSSSVEAGGASASVTANQVSNEPGINIVATYTLRDNVKWLETRMQWVNTNAIPYSKSALGSSAVHQGYLIPGGSSGNGSGDISFGKTIDGLAVNTANTWFGAGGSPLAPALEEGWLAVVDPAADVTLATTWDIDQQAAHALGIPGQRLGYFSNRVTFEVYYQTIEANSTLDYIQTLIVDDGIPSVSYAKEGQLIAGIPIDKPVGDKYDIGSTLTATFQLNSLNPSAAASYDIKNIRVESKDPFGGSPNFNIAPFNGVNVPANGHVTAGTRTVTLVDASLVAGQSYYVKADLYPAGGSEMITTLMSRPFVMADAGTRVFLYQDTAGSWVLENEVYKAVISPVSPQQARLTNFELKKANNRNQTITSIPPHPLFRDYIQPDKAQIPFGGYFEPTIVEDTATRKALQFQAPSPAGDGGYLTKTYALSSMSSALEVKIKFDNGATALNGGGFFSDLEMAPGGTGGSADTFFTHTVDGPLSIHPPASELTSFRRWYFGESWNTEDGADRSVGIPAELPALDQGWMGVLDANVTDATVVAWDQAKQTQFSLPLEGSGTKVPMNTFGIGANYDRTVLEPRFTNIPANATLETTVYLIGDTGYRALSYVEQGRVMAGVWPTAADAPAGSPFSVGTTLTNIGVTARTFDLKNIRITDGTTETVVGTDQTGIALDPATRDSRTLTLAIPASQAQGSYSVLVDLYEGATKVATLQTLPFNVVGGIVANGDVDNNQTVDLDDARLALRIWGGLTAADAGQVARGDVFAGTPGLTLEDVLTIVQSFKP